MTTDIAVRGDPSSRLSGRIGEMCRLQDEAVATITRCYLLVAAMAVMTVSVPVTVYVLQGPMWAAIVLAAYLVGLAFEVDQTMRIIRIIRRRTYLFGLMMERDAMELARCRRE